MTPQQTCCFTGHRPGKLPWGNDQSDPRCLRLQQGILRELERLYQLGCRHFISGMALGCDLYFTQAVLHLRRRRPDVTLEGAVPCPEQADRWPEEDRRQWRALLDACDLETVVQHRYDRYCMLRRDRYMVDRSRYILAVFDGSPGGTRYTLDYASRQGLHIFLLNLARPQSPALWLRPPTAEGRPEQLKLF